MRKWLAIGMLSAAAIIGVGAYWYFTKSDVANRNPRHPGGVQANNRNAKNDGNAEASDVIEPLIVQRLDNGNPDDVHGEFGVELTILPRVLLKPGMQQPPRPDGGGERRMPYADEEAGVGFWLIPNLREIEASLARLNIFKEIEKADPAEESENKQPDPPMDRPQPNPAPDYHHSYPHCPYHGHCPAPYRPTPRN